jgi:hypothetical protein
MNVHTSHGFDVILYFYCREFYKFLESYMRFTVTADSDVRDIKVGASDVRDLVFRDLGVLEVFICRNY